jgi:hypothetical protein
VPSAYGLGEYHNGAAGRIRTCDPPGHRSLRARSRRSTLLSYSGIACMDGPVASPALSPLAYSLRDALVSLLIATEHSIHSAAAPPARDWTTAFAPLHRSRMRMEKRVVDWPLPHHHPGESYTVQGSGSDSLPHLPNTGAALGEVSRLAGLGRSPCCC